MKIDRVLGRRRIENDQIVFVRLHGLQQTHERGELLAPVEIADQLLIQAVVEQAFGDAGIDCAEHEFVEFAARFDHRGAEAGD